MADNINVPVPSSGTTVPVASDEVTIDGQTVQAQRTKTGFGGIGDYTDVSAADPLPTAVIDGEFGYASGTTSGTVQVPAGARLRRVALLAAPEGAATVGIGTGPAITIPAGAAWDEDVKGEVIAPAVLFAGQIATYYVAWAV